MPRPRAYFVFASSAILTPATFAALPAFPGAEGFGALATGGRNSADVYHVTSLADTNTTGTLRNAISTSPSAGRTIVFDVSGTIHLSNNLNINKSNLTMAGQTAPGVGITLTGWQTSVSGSNVILRYLRFRPGDTNAPLKNPAANFQGDALNVTGPSLSSPAQNIIIDHVSASWGIDEVLSASYFNNVTVQNSMIAEGLANAGHTNDAGTGIEEHSMGSLVRYGSGQITFARNLYESNGTRNPRVGDNIKADFVNNVVYNWVGQPAYTGSSSEGITTVNWRGNYNVIGPNTSSTTARAFVGGSTSTILYQSGNLVDNTRNGVLNGTPGTNSGWSFFTGSYTQGTGAFPAAPVPVTFRDATTNYYHVLNTAGASLTRDSVDTRLIASARTFTGSIIDSQDQVGGWDTTPGTSRPAGFDTDNDGMPNTWELAHGLNPNLKDNNTLLPTGYTALELYLYSLAPSLPGDANADMLITPDDYTLLDRGFAQHLTGWFNGDFNSDGTVDQQDYLEIDRTALSQSLTSPDALLPLRESQFGPTYVTALQTSIPEPLPLSSILYSLSSFSLLRRRRR